MRIAVIDTNILIDLFHGDISTGEEISRYDRILVPSIVIGEYKAGIRPGTENGKLQTKCLNDFLDSSVVDAISVSEETADCYARIFRYLKNNGIPKPQNDIWIAASAVEYNAEMLSHDGHFSEIPLLKIADSQ